MNSTLRTEAIMIAQSVMARRTHQPIPLSQVETEVLAQTVLGLTEERIDTVPVDATTLLSANDRQVDGLHYGGTSHQHWDIVVEHQLDYFQGQVTKYIMRWRKKNGLTDLEKAKHFLEKYIEEIQAGRNVQ